MGGVLVRKELREGLGATLIVAILSTIAWTAQVSWWHWTTFEAGHVAGVFLVALFGGVLLGTGQVQLENARGTWPYLLHRGVEARAILAAKRRAGLVLGALLVPLPVLFAYHLHVLAAPGLWNAARVLELLALAGWFVPAYAVGQWQALSDAGRSAEGWHRVALSIGIAGGPFALLAKLAAEHLPAPSGWFVLVGTEVVFASVAFALGRRRFEALASRGRVLPRGEATATAVFAGVVLSLLVAAITHEVRDTPTTRLEAGRAPVLVDGDGRLATWRAAGVGYDLVTFDGEVVGTSRTARRTFGETWQEVRTAREDRHDRNYWRRMASDRGAPFLLRSWNRLGSTWPEAEARRTCDVSCLQPSGAVVAKYGGPHEAERLLEVEGPDGAPLVLSRDAQVHSVLLDEDGDPDTRGMALAVFEPGATEVTLVTGTGGATRVPLPGGDEAVRYRLERTPREGMSDDTLTVLVGRAGEYRWNAAELAFEPWIDPTPFAPLEGASDPFDLVATVDGRSATRAWTDVWSRAPAAVWVHLGTLVRAPLGSLVSAVVPARADANRAVGWTLGLDWNVAGGRRPLLLVVHLLLGAVLAAWVARRLRGRANRGLWVLVAAALGVLGLVVIAVETRNRKELRASQG